MKVPPNKTSFSRRFGSTLFQALLDCAFVNLHDQELEQRLQALSNHIPVLRSAFNRRTVDSALYSGNNDRDFDRRLAYMLYYMPAYVYQSAIGLSLCLAQTQGHRRQTLTVTSIGGGPLPELLGLLHALVANGTNAHMYETIDFVALDINTDWGRCADITSAVAERICVEFRLETVLQVEHEQFDLTGMISDRIRDRLVASDIVVCQNLLNEIPAIKSGDAANNIVRLAGCLNAGSRMLLSDQTKYDVVQSVWSSVETRLTNDWYNVLAFDHDERVVGEYKFSSITSPFAEDPSMVPSSVREHFIDHSNSRAFKHLRCGWRVVAPSAVPDQERDEWLAAGFSYNEAGEWSECGFTPVEARDWKVTNTNPYKAQLWRQFSPLAAQRWIGKGIPADQALSWLELASFEELGVWEAAGFKLPYAIEWREHFAESATAADWKAKNFSPSEARSWHDAQFTVLDASRWFFHFRPVEALEWIEAGFDADESRWWAQLDLRPRSAAKLKKLGLSCDEYRTLRRSGMFDNELSDATPSLLKCWTELAKRRSATTLRFIAEHLLHQSIPIQDLLVLSDSELSHVPALLTLGCDATLISEVRKAGILFSVFAQLLQAGVPMSDARRSIDKGAEALQKATNYIYYGIEPEEVFHWLRLDFSLTEARAWSAAGFTADVAAGWSKVTSDPELAKLVRASLRTTHKSVQDAWLSELPVLTWRRKIDVNVAIDWIKNNFTPAGVIAWLGNPRSPGPAQARRYCDALNIDEAIAAHWHKIGASEDEVPEWIRRGYSWEAVEKLYETADISPWDAPPIGSASLEESRVN